MMLGSSLRRLRLGLGVTYDVWLLFKGGSEFGPISRECVPELFRTRISVQLCHIGECRIRGHKITPTVCGAVGVRWDLGRCQGEMGHFGLGLGLELGVVAFAPAKTPVALGYGASGHAPLNGPLMGQGKPQIRLLGLGSEFRCDVQAWVWA